MLHSNHPDDQVLELYAREKLGGLELETVEEHLLVCEGCQDRVEETDSYVRGMRSALALPENVRESERWQFPNLLTFPAPVWAAAAVLLLAMGGIVATRSLTLSAPPVAIALSATRGEISTVAATGPLDLDLDTRDLPPSGPYKLQVVNAEGGEVWKSTAAELRNGHVHARVDKRLAPGQYFVRIVTAAGDQREFSLRLKN